MKSTNNNNHISLHIRDTIISVRDVSEELRMPPGISHAFSKEVPHYCQVWWQGESESITDACCLRVSAESRCLHLLDKDECYLLRRGIPLF